MKKHLKAIGKFMFSWEFIAGMWFVFLFHDIGGWAQNIVHCKPNETGWKCWTTQPLFTGNRSFELEEPK
jgi:hypothetical protein